MATIKCLVFMTCLVDLILAFTLNAQNDIDFTKCLRSNQAHFIEGIKNIVDTSDPIGLDIVSGNLPEFKYQLTKAKLSGLKDCIVTKLRVNKEKSRFDYNLECPHVELDAKYFYTGEMANIAVEEEGDLRVTTGLYIFKFQGYYEKTLGEDGKDHAHIKHYHLDFDVRDRVTFQFSNLTYVGDKVKSDAFHKFVNENWINMEKAVRAPVLNSFMDVFIKNLNKFLNVVPIEEVFKAAC